MGDDVFDAEAPTEPDPLLDQGEHGTPAPALEPQRFRTQPDVQAEGPRTLHRYADTAPGYQARTRCGLVVFLAKTTQDDGRVSCGNCAKAHG